MKKFISWAVALAAVATLATSCLIEGNNGITNNKGGDTELTITISNPVATRTVQLPGQSGVSVNQIVNGHIYILDAMDYVYDATEFTINPAAAAQDISFPRKVPRDSRIFIIANLPETTSPFDTNVRKLSDIKALAYDISTQTDYTQTAQANTGGTPVAIESYVQPDPANDPTVPDSATVPVELLPVVSRLELASIEAAGDIKSFTVTGVFLTDYYEQFTYGSGPAGEPVTFTAPNLATVMAGNFGDTGSWPAETDSGTGKLVAKPTDGKVWAFNVPAGSKPRIVVRLANVTTSDSATPQGEVVYLTMSGYINVPDPQTFVPGMIYTVPKISFTENHLSLTPNDTDAYLGAEVNVGTWGEQSPGGEVQYQLALSGRSIELGREAYTAASTGNRLRIYTNHPDGWQITSITDVDTEATPDWLTIAAADLSGADKEIVLTTTENDTAAARTATITISAGRMKATVAVTQTLEDYTYYSVTVNPATGGTAQASPKTAREGDTVELLAAPATGYILTGWGVTGATATQDPNNPNRATLTVGTSEITVAPTFAEVQFTAAVTTGFSTPWPATDYITKTITVTSNVPWTVALSDNTNFTTGGDNPTGNTNPAGGSFTVVPTSDNTANNSRPLTITVSGGEVVRTITLSQEGTPTDLLVMLPVSMTWAANETAPRQVQVVSPVGWSVTRTVGSENPDDNPAFGEVFVQSGITGNGGGTFGSFDIAPTSPNTSGIPRTATFTVTTGKGSFPVKVTQLAAEPTITITEPGTFDDFRWTGKHTQTFTVTSNVPWTSIVAGEGFSVTATTGNDAHNENGWYNGTVTVLAGPNNSLTDTRAGEVSVQGAFYAPNETDFTDQSSGTPIALTQVIRSAILTPDGVPEVEVGNTVWAGTSIKAPGVFAANRNEGTSVFRWGYDDVYAGNYPQGPDLYTTAWNDHRALCPGDYPNDPYDWRLPTWSEIEALVPIDVNLPAGAPAKYKTVWWQWLEGPSYVAWPEGSTPENGIWIPRTNRYEAGGQYTGWNYTFIYYASAGRTLMVSWSEMVARERSAGYSTLAVIRCVRTL